MPRITFFTKQQDKKLWEEAREDAKTQGVSFSEWLAQAATSKLVSKGPPASEQAAIDKIYRIIKGIAR